MYSPKIADDLIPTIYRVAKARHLTMTGLVDRILRKELIHSEFASYELPAFWVNALLDPKRSFLMDHDTKRLEAWISTRRPGICVDVGERCYFKERHDAYDFVGPCEVAEYVFLKEAPI